MEQSAYNFEHADVENLFAQFTAAERGCGSLLEANLPLPAYEQVLKSSHIFNLLDARNALGVTERARYIGRVRNLARTVAQSYFDARESLGFPRLRREKSPAQRRGRR